MPKLSFGLFATVMLVACSTSPAVVGSAANLDEELFRTGYQPQDVDDVGEPLLVAPPGSGELPSRFEGLKQSAVQAASRSSRPAADASLDLYSDLPLLEGVGSKTLGVAPALTALRAAPAAAPQQASMSAHFIDVGQGDATLLEFPCGLAVIDVGGEYTGNKDGARLFVDYMEAFFASHPQYNRTIDVVFLTHAHKDHIGGTALMYPNGKPLFVIKNVVDNGETGDAPQSGLELQTTFRKAAKKVGAKYSAVQLTLQATATGSTNAVIDPFPACKGVDPKIKVYWGHVTDKNSGKPISSNPNNHSVVVRVDFGKSSFLFPGDLQEDGAKKLRKAYASNPGEFDVDVYHVAHHGASNGVSDAFLEKLTPKIAVLSMGDKGSPQAKGYGHPNINAVNTMQQLPEVVAGKRDPVTRWTYSAGNVAPKDTVIDHAIFGTAWDGTVVLEATTEGSYRIAGKQIN